MRHKPIAAWVWLSFACVAANAAGVDWPKLVGGENRSECRTVLRLAQSAYRSTAFHLWEPQPLPDDLRDRLVLGPLGVDLSGGAALDVNLDVFTQVPLPDYEARSFYWQTQTRQGNRLVVEEMPFGWRGDQYAVRWVPATLTPAEYMPAAHRPSGAGLTTLIHDAWRAPLVFQSKGDGHLWVVYVGEPFIFSPNWIVFLPTADQLQEACRVQFRPDVKQATALLPAPVRRLATLLDQTMGSGQDEGTLHPTALLRIRVEQAWANAALRPWAMGTPYNSREEVDAGLSEWADNAEEDQTALAKIQTQYTIAEKALTAYYKTRFHMSASASRHTAQSVLDTALRTHYTFSKPR